MRSYFVELSLAFLSVGIKLSQEHSLCSCRDTQPLINATSLGFFHLETESKETHMGIIANQLHLTHGIWSKGGSYYSRGSVWNNREEIRNCNTMKFLEASLDKFLVNPNVSVQKIDYWRLFYLLPGESLRILGGRGSNYLSVYKHRIEKGVLFFEFLKNT